MKGAGSPGEGEVCTDQARLALAAYARLPRAAGAALPPGGCSTLPPVSSEGGNMGRAG